MTFATVYVLILCNEVFGICSPLSPDMKSISACNELRETMELAIRDSEELYCLTKSVEIEDENDKT